MKRSIVKATEGRFIGDGRDKSAPTGCVNQYDLCVNSVAEEIKVTP